MAVQWTAHLTPEPLCEVPGGWEGVIDCSDKEAQSALRCPPGVGSADAPVHCHLLSCPGSLTALGYSFSMLNVTLMFALIVLFSLIPNVKFNSSVFSYHFCFL